VDRRRSQQQRALVLTVVHTPPAPAGAGPRPHEAVRQMLREEMLDEHVDDPEANVPANDAVGAAAAEADPDADLAAVTTAAADAAEAGGAATDAAEAAQWEAGLYSELGASASAEIAAPEDDDAGPSVLSQVLPTLPRHDRALLRAVAAVAAVEFHPTVLVHGNVLDLETSSVIRARPRRFVALPGAAPGTAPVPEESVAAVQAELEAAAAARAEAEAAAEAAATAAPKRASGVLRPASRRSALGIDRAELARPAARAEEAQETEPAAVAPALVRRASAAEISAETAAIIASASASAAEANLSYSIDSGVSASAGYTSTLLGWQAGQPFLPSGDLAHSAAAAAAVSATAAVRVSAAELDAMAGALSVARGDTPLDAPWVRGQSPALRALEDAAVLGGRPMPVVAATGGDIDADADAGGADGSGEVDLSDPEARARWLLARAEIKRAARAARRERKEANAAARTTAEQAEALLQRERNAVRRAKEREAAAAYADRVQAEKDARTDAWSKANRGRQERLLRESGEAPSYEPRERSAERAPRNSSSVGEDTLPSRSRWHNDTRDNRAGSRPSPQRGGNKTDRDAVPTEREARPRRQVDAAPAQRDRGYSLLRGGEYGGAVPQYYGPRGDRSERAQKQAAYDHGEKQRAEERQMRQEEQQEAARRKRSEARAANKPEKIWIPDARDVLFGDSAKPIRKTRV
jgi:SWI/SNF-related matrix-associated actin-dependent regulator 1 of chromatin subfamily A